MENGGQEKWSDTVIRVVEGIMSIRMSHYKENGIRWDQMWWSALAERMAEYIFEMKFLPPGRGLWAMGSEYVYERGSAALNNCGYTEVTTLSQDAAWAMDMLMVGVGIGFGTQPLVSNSLPKHLPNEETLIWTIPDTREGWIQSVSLLIESYEVSNHPTVMFDYSKIRPIGELIKGFGGLASGPAPLKELHERLRVILHSYVTGEVSSTRLIADVFNSIGCCVVAGNVRRSAELATGSINDTEFLNLKNYSLNPDRASIGWMSNNSVVLSESEHFDLLPSIAERIKDNGEPGVINLINVQKYGRYGKKKYDPATGTNPCAEVCLEDKELCCLVEVFPTRCETTAELFEAFQLATIYASTVTLLPTHSPETNKVMQENRRIGVSVSGVADWLDATHMSHVHRMLDYAYENVVIPTNQKMALEAGIPESVRVTTVKPSGTISNLPGVSPGMHHPVFRYGIRRMRVSEQSPLVDLLVASGIPNEPDAYSSGTLVFEFPLEMGAGVTRSVDEVSIWEQVSIAAFLQRVWSDNAVSNTLTFNPSTEGEQVERVLTTFAPLVKSMSMLPNQAEQQSYVQAPYERISREEWRERMRKIKQIDWSSFGGSDGMDSRFCDSEVCEI